MSRAKAKKTRPKFHLQKNFSNKTHKRTPHSHKNLTSNQKQHTQKQERNCDKIIVVLSEKTQVKIKKPTIEIFQVCYEYVLLFLCHQYCRVTNKQLREIEQSTSKNIRPKLDLQTKQKKQKLYKQTTIREMSRAIAKETKPKIYVQKNINKQKQKKFNKQRNIVEKSRARAKIQGLNSTSRQIQTAKHQR